MKKNIKSKLIACSTLVALFTILILAYSDAIGQKASDNTYPCQLSNPDTSVFNIILNDKESSTKRVGANFHLREDTNDMPYEQFCTQDKKQTLTLFFHPGGVENEFSEFQVKYYSNSDTATILKTNNFVTGKGVMLGLLKKDVVSIFGNCFKTINKHMKSETIRYNLDDFGNSDFLQRFNCPSYYAEYEFLSDKLVRFRFGFEYP